MVLGKLRGRISDLLRVYFGGLQKIKQRTKNNFHFWETYWIALNCLFTGGYIGFGLSGISVIEFLPILILIWCSFTVFVMLFRIEWRKI
jgi:hypothetical protein